MADQGRIHIVIDGDASELNKALADVKKSLENTGSETEKLDKKVKKSSSSVGASLSGMAARYISLAAAIGIVSKAVKNAFEVNKSFERKNSELASVLGTTKDGMEKLTTAAKELGRTTEFTSSEVVDLQMALARLGFTQAQILDMEGPVLKFAAAVNAELGRASNFAGAALRGFGLEAKDTEHLLDVMAAATTKSALDFSKLETSMSIVAPVAHAFGLSVEDTVTLLGSLANAGFDASSAATATRNILLNLADANGKLAKGLGHTARTFPEIIAALKECAAKGIDLNSTLEMTDKRSVAAFNALITGAASADELRDALGNVDGTLNDMYETMTNNVAGAIKQLQSAWEGLMLTMQNSTGPMASVIKRFARGINIITDMLEGKSLKDARTKQDAEALMASGMYKTSDDYSAAIDQLERNGVRGMKQMRLLNALRYARTQQEIKEYDAIIDSAYTENHPKEDHNKGGGSGTLSEAEKKAIKRYRDAYEKAVKQLWKDAANSEVDAMKEGTAKKLAQIENERVQALAQIEDDRKEIEKNAKSAGVSVDPEVYKQLEEREKNAEEVAKNKREEVVQDQLKNQWDYLIAYGNNKERERAITDKYNAEIEKTDDEFLKKTLERQRDEELAQNNSLREFETYKQAEERINREFDEKIAKMDPVEDADNIAKAEKERKKALSALKAEELSETEVWKKLLGDLDTYSTDLLASYITTAEQLLDNTNNLTSEDLKNFLAAIKKAREEIIRRNPFKSLKDAYESYRKAVESGDDAAKKQAAKEMRQAVDESNGQIQAIAGSVSDLLTLFGDRGDRLSGMVKNISSVIDSAANAISAFEAFEAGAEGATAGGAYAAAAAFLYTGGKFFKELSEQLNDEADRSYMERLDFLDEYRLALAKLKTEDYETIFGTKTIAATADAYRKMNEALAQYEQQYKKIGGIFGGSSSSDMFDLSRVYKFAGSSKYGGDLRDMVIRTYKSLTGFFDKYQRLSDLAPELWGGNPATGEFDIEAAKAFLETNTQITDEQRRQIELLIKQKEAYEEASKYIDDTISNSFRDLGSEITDIIWDSVVNGGEDAWEQFGKLGSKYITALGKDLLQEMIVTEYLEQFRDQMRNAYSLGSPEAIQAEMRSITASIFGGMKSMFNAGSAVAEEWNAWAQANGFNLSENTEETRKAATKASIGATQDSVDESNARLATLQGHTFEMNENVKEMKNQHAQLVANTAALLEHVQGIHGDTSDMRVTMTELRSIATTIKSGVGTIVDRGVKAI